MADIVDGVAIIKAFDEWFISPHGLANPSSVLWTPWLVLTVAAATAPTTTAAPAT
jgi:hypothetical protein